MGIPQEGRGGERRIITCRDRVIRKEKKRIRRKGGQLSLRKVCGWKELVNEKLKKRSENVRIIASNPFRTKEKKGGDRQ